MTERFRHNMSQTDKTLKNLFRFRKWLTTLFENFLENRQPLDKITALRPHKQGYSRNKELVRGLIFFSLMRDALTQISQVIREYVQTTWRRN